MQMKPDEIMSSYRQSKDKAKQLVILSQLNSTSVDNIKQILLDQGLDYRQLPRSKRENASSKETKKSEPKKFKDTDKDTETYSLNYDNIIQYILDLRNQKADLQKQIHKIDEELNNIALNANPPTPASIGTSINYHIKSPQA